MNRNGLAKLRDHRVRLRPVARRFDEFGVELSPEDDLWGVGQASKDGLVLSNFRTGHIAILKPDAIHHFQEDAGEQRGFLELHVQVMLQGRKLFVEPLVPGTKRAEFLPVARLPVQSPPAVSRRLGDESLWVLGLGVLLVTAIASSR